jgi:hypothetical protein
MDDPPYLVAFAPSANSPENLRIGGAIVQDEYPVLSLDILQGLINNYVSDCNQIHQMADRQFQYYYQFQLLDLF